MWIKLDATPAELYEKGDDLIKAIMQSVGPVCPELSERLEKALPEKKVTLRYRALRDIHEITQKEYQKTLDAIHLDISRVLDQAAHGTSVGQSLEKSFGDERPGHKYIKRDGTPGHYAYTYAEGANPRYHKLPAQTLSHFETDVREVLADPEAHGLEPDEVNDLRAVHGAIDYDKGTFRLPDHPEAAEHISSVLTDMSNEHDRIANDKYEKDAARKKFSRHLSQGLSTLSSKVGQSAIEPEKPSDLPREQLLADAHDAVKPQVIDAAMRATAVGAEAASLKYVGAGMEGIIFQDGQGRAYKVSRNRSDKHPNRLRNEAEAMMALADSPVAHLVAKVHGYDKQHDVITRDMIQGSSAGWGQSKRMQEAYQEIAHELGKRGWTAPEFKEDSFIVPQGGGEPVMVDMGMIHPKGAVLAARLKERVENLNPKDDWFDYQLDVSHAYQEGTIDAPTALGYLDRGGAGIEGVTPDTLARTKEGLAFTARNKGDLAEGQTWKDIGGKKDAPDPKVDDKVPVTVHSAISGRESEDHPYRVVSVKGDTVQLSRYEGSDYGPTMPKASVKHFQNDLAGKVDLPPSGNPDIDSVISGKAKFLGKGDDGLAFKSGNKVVKVSTTVPYQPENPGHRTPKEAADMLKKQVEVGNALADAGVPGIQRSEFVQHGDKGFQIKPWVEIPEKFTREQLDAVQDSMIAMHKQGYALNDEPQAGLDAEGKPVMFDVGKAAKNAGDPKDRDSHASADMERLSFVYKKNGEKFVRRDYSEGERHLEHYHARSLEWMRDKKHDFAKHNLKQATEKLESEARAKFKGSQLDSELAKIKEQYDSEMEFWGTVADVDAKKEPEKPALALTSAPTEKPKRKRTPVIAKPKEDESAPLPGQQAMLGAAPIPGKKKVRKPVQHALFAEPEKQKPEDKPLPGQLPLI